jgi:sensor histidine kinase YesM
MGRHRKSYPEGTCGFSIAPFMIIPFLENAFKHVSKEINKPNWITMDLHLDNHELIFSISNSVSPGYHPPQELFYAGGIGLKNVKRRLDLIYDSKHDLTITHDDHLFSVSLRLQLTEMSMTEPEMIPARLSVA